MAICNHEETDERNSQIEIENRLHDIDKNTVINTILKGLLCEHKYISSLFFYDETGSQLFKEITQLPEYYIPRIEKPLIREASIQLLSKLKNVNIVEFGSGDCSKISVFLEPVPVENLSSICYVPVDISHSVIMETAQTLPHTFPGLKIHCILADFIQHAELLPAGKQHIFCMFGSTIGNLTREQGMQFCFRVSEIMQPEDVFLLGLDMVKERNVLFDAYNDSRNITANFNRNILNVVNNLTGTTFDPEIFEHIAFFNEEEARIEMYLRATRDMKINSPYCSETIQLKSGEPIHTENSHKFTPYHIAEIGKAAELKIEQVYTDKHKWFSLVKFIKSKQDYV